MTVGASGQLRVARQPVDAADRAQGVAHERGPADAGADDRHLVGRAGAAAGGGRRPTVGTKDFEFDVERPTPRARSGRRSTAPTATTTTSTSTRARSRPDNVVASSASETADEALVYDYPEPGHYILSVQNWLATGGWTGTLKVFGSVPGTEVIVPGGHRGLDGQLHRPNGKLSAPSRSSSTAASARP